MFYATALTLLMMSFALLMFDVFTTISVVSKLELTVCVAIAFASALALLLSLGLHVGFNITMDHFCELLNFSPEESIRDHPARHERLGDPESTVRDDRKIILLGSWSRLARREKHPVSKIVVF